MKQTLIFVAVLVAMVASQSCPFCDDWTSCRLVRCAPPKRCTKDAPYLVYDNCGCCQRCRETPRTGPCGTCGVDVICKESEPTCSEGQIVSLDYCGCCKVCMDVLQAGENCTTCCDPYFSVCAAGLRCINGTCAEPNLDY